MKPALRGLLVLVPAGIATQAGAAAPARMHTVPYSGFFWTPKVGLLGVGLCSSTKYMCGSGAVELTTDGGRTYHVIVRTPRPVFELRAIGRDGALARVYSDTTYSSSRVVYRTLDRGRRWTTMRMPPDVSFATAKIGLGVRDNGIVQSKLRRTVDGGQSWKPISTPRLCGWAALLDLVTPKLGWLVCVGQPAAGEEEKAVFGTRDGGRTWSAGAAAVLKSRGGMPIVGYPAGISFARNGFGLMWESRGMLLVTRDGGKTWQAHFHFVRFDVDFGLGGSAFGNGTGLVLYQHGGLSARLIETRDFGRSWHIVRSWRG